MPQHSRGEDRLCCVCVTEATPSLEAKLTTGQANSSCLTLASTETANQSPVCVPVSSQPWVLRGQPLDPRGARPSLQQVRYRQPPQSPGYRLTVFRLTGAARSLTEARSACLPEAAAILLSALTANTEALVYIYKPLPQQKPHLPEVQAANGRM